MGIARTPGSVSSVFVIPGDLSWLVTEGLGVDTSSAVPASAERRGLGDGMRFVLTRQNTLKNTSCIEGELTWIFFRASGDFIDYGTRWVG